MIATDMQKIKCELCGKEYHQIGSSHLGMHHKISCAEYNVMFPNAPFYSHDLIGKASTSKKLNGSCAKENNPMYGRCGEANPLFGKTYEEIMGIEKAAIVKSKRADQARNGNGLMHSDAAKAKYVAKRKYNYANGIDVAWNKGLTKETNDKIAELAKQASVYWKNSDRRGSNHPFWWKHHSVESKLILASKNKINQERNIRNPEFILKYIKGLNTKPNKGELKLQKVLKELYPNEFEYNGDYGLGVSIDGLIPDFWNVNGQKKVIELFGEYWHSKCIKKPKQVETKRVKRRYRNQGVECLVVWENELNLHHRRKLINKIVRFVDNKQSSIKKC